MSSATEACKSDQVRIIGTKICRYANGSCLCQEKGRTLCNNVKGLAIECWEAAHQAELSRAEFNQANRVAAHLDGPGPSAKSGAKKIRGRA